jgi:aerotolerance regulator-like protein
VIWLNPAALIALAAVAVPVLIHVLVQRRAERVAFPTLRFLRPTRLAAIRRHVLEDPLLLAVRMLIVAAAVAAVSGPLLVTRARRDVWSDRIVRAVVTTSDARTDSSARDTKVYRSAAFRAALLGDGIRRAIDWLEHAPPARRELLVAAPLTIGTLTAADLADVPRDVGIAFERSGAARADRTVLVDRVLTATGPLDREVTVAGPTTMVRDLSPADASDARAPIPLEVTAAAAARPVVAAAIAAVLSKRVWSPPPSRRARLLIVDSGDGATMAPNGAGGPIDPWIADAIARITRDGDLQRAAAHASGTLADERFSRSPWHRVAAGSERRPLVAATAEDARLVVASGAAASDVVTPILVRAIVNAMADVPDLTPGEVVPIPDPQLRAWSRPAAAVAQPRLDAVDADDRRWLWIAVLGMLALETWLRRSRRSRDAAAGDEESVRVA